jgi:butyryl-CoA dehydrogenase
MVYRTLGDVDRALEAVAPGDSGAVLKTIEGYAVECSINKVFTSEALAYVVDEALQVFGGNGYSREFPAERAYRDARITRIYEGTNEINRLIISTRLLKHRDAGLKGPRDTDDSILRAEHELLRQAKALACTLLSDAAKAFGDSVKEEQEVLADIADVVIEVYAIESTLARTEKLHAARGGEAAAVALDIARVYTADAADRIAGSAKQVLRRLPSRADRDRLAPFISFAGVDGVAARRRISDAIVVAAKHPY